MRLPATTLATAALAICLLFSTVGAADVRDGLVRGVVTDGSDAVLPGVTVVAATASGRVLATTVTDGSGRYMFGALPAGPVVLQFQLDGFAAVVVGLTVQAGVETRVVKRLELASLSETVLVQAPAPVDPPRPVVTSPPLPPPPPPAPVVRSVPPHDRDSICGPAKPGAAVESLGTIRSSRYETGVSLYAAGAQLIIDGGLQNGLEVGHNLVVRHYYSPMGSTGADAKGEHSAGLLQIVEVSEGSSVAVVVYACDEMQKGDFLAAFKPEPIRPPDPLGIPAYRDAARILFADEDQGLGTPRRLMVIDRGLEHGVRVGQRLTLFRRPGRGAARPDIVGDAVVVAVRADSATIRIERVTDAISSGDWAAPQHPAPVARLPPDAPASGTARSTFPVDR